MSNLEAMIHWSLAFVLFAVGVMHDVKGSIHGEAHIRGPMQRTDGDILIGGLVMVHADGKIRDDGIQTVEVINKIVDQINLNDSILPGITLGTMIIDTKRIDSYTLHQIVVEFLPKFWLATNASCMGGNGNSREMPPMFAGVIGAASSDVSIESAKLLQGFSIPQISYWSTNPTLSDKELFPYFFRTIPSDEHQIAAIVEFVKRQGWNYVSIVYEDSYYGSTAYSAFEKSANEKEICAAVAYRMPKQPTSQDYQSIVKELYSTQNARAVLLFVLSDAAREILTAAAVDSEAAGKFIWVATDAWTKLLPEETDELDSYQTELNGTIGFAPKADPIVGFDEHFTGIRLGDRQDSAARKNPWFSEYISMKNNCSTKKNYSHHPTNSRSTHLTKRNCSEDEVVAEGTFTLFPYIENVANAVLLFAHAIDKVQKKVCDGVTGICPEMAQMRGTNDLARETYKALKGISITGINDRTFKFDKNHDAPADYYVYNYKRKTNETSENKMEKWVKVAEISSKGIIKNFSTLSDKVGRIRSHCSNECNINEAKKIEAVKCCWTCERCFGDEYVLNRTQCEKCDDGSRPNGNFTGCEIIAVRFASFESPYGIVSIALGISGVVCTMIVLAAFVKERDTPIAKASGKELCFFVIVGVTLTFTNCWAIMTSPTAASCAISRLILSLGPTIMYSALLTKTLRIVIIFQSKIMTPRVKRFLQPSIQLALTSAIVLLQVFAMVVWMIVSPPRREVYQRGLESAFRTCVGLVQPTILIGLVFPFVLIIVCTVLATINRHVPYGFNEAKHIGFTMYTTCVIWLAFIPIFVANKEHHELKLMTVSICLSLSAFTVLFCMFAPRCYMMLFHSEKNTSQSVMSTGRNTPGNSVNGNESAQIRSIKSRSASRGLPMETTM